MILHFFRGLDFAAAAGSRASGRWDTGPFYAADTPVRELGGSTVGVVGFGGVGRAVGVRCGALGARVLGLRRSLPEPGPRALETALELPGGRGTVPARVLAGPEGLAELLASSDAVVLCVPDTPETRGMVDAAALGRMKPSAVLVNVARGRVVDENALAEALEARRLRGAALDVSAREPLPDDHPLWTLDNVLLTPHVSAVTDRFWERETALVVENAARLAAGEPLRNVVDPERGY
ncbi:MAG TPA: NAD(P)-dependent oxidoreductase, partial [Longimicrobiales bacterium]|jgi:phosphoglycerate dehydrogenase-like enzyme|nr:NAD(P)-dependent oxidoreductase [Longimicrobiales bacterium]